MLYLKTKTSLFDKIYYKRVIVLLDDWRDSPMKDIREIDWNDNINKFGNPSDDKKAVVRPGIYGVCVKDGKLLIVKSRLGGFIVGGGIESSESDEECLKRETLEEIGYDIEVKDWLEDIIEYIYVPERDKSYVKTMRFYKINLLEYITEATEKDHFIEWIDKSEIESSMYLNGQAYILDKYFAKL